MTKLQNVVWVTTCFEGWHRWKNAPAEHVYLRDWHRHIFHVKLYVTVTHDDRDVEFIHLKRKVTEFLRAEYEGQKFEDSCESIANRLLAEFTAFKVEVSEDGENGAVAEKVKIDDLTIVEKKPVQLPATQKRSKIFIGTEAEGPFRGKQTLFIPGSCSIEDIKRVVDNPLFQAEFNGPIRVYYGAGNSWDIESPVLEYLMKWTNPSKLTVEVFYFGSQLLKDLNPDDRFLMTIVAQSCDKELINQIDFLKILTDTHVIWLGNNKQYWINRLDDPLYQQDKEIGS